MDLDFNLDLEINTDTNNDIINNMDLETSGDNMDLDLEIYNLGYLLNIIILFRNKYNINNIDNIDNIEKQIINLLFILSKLSNNLNDIHEFLINSKSLIENIYIELYKIDSNLLYDICNINNLILT